MEAGSKVMWDNEEVVGALSAVPVRPVMGNITDSTSHHPRGFERQREAIGSEVACCVHGSVEPVGFVRIQRAHGTFHKKIVKKLLHGEHVSETSRVFLQPICVILPGKPTTQPFIPWRSSEKVSSSFERDSYM